MVVQHYSNVWLRKCSDFRPPGVLRALRAGGLLIVDNVLSHPDEVAPFLAIVSAGRAVTSTLVPVGAGVQLIVKNPKV